MSIASQTVWVFKPRRGFPTDGSTGLCQACPVANDAPELYLITGVMAAGKSTVGQALAERFERSAHVRGDTFRRSIVSGRAEMSASPSTAALDQLRLRYRLAVASAEAYVAAGYTTVLQDTIIGPMLAEVAEMFTVSQPRIVVLTPSLEAIYERERDRTKTGYTSFIPEDLDTVLRNGTPPLGEWVDSTHLTVEETVDEILARFAAPLP